MGNTWAKMSTKCYCVKKGAKPGKRANTAYAHAVKAVQAGHTDCFDKVIGKVAGKSFPSLAAKAAKYRRKDAVLVMFSLWSDKVGYDDRELEPKFSIACTMDIPNAIKYRLDEIKEGYLDPRQHGFTMEELVVTSCKHDSIECLKLLYEFIDDDMKKSDLLEVCLSNNSPQCLQFLLDKGIRFENPHRFLVYDNIVKMKNRDLIEKLIPGGLKRPPTFPTDHDVLMFTEDYMYDHCTPLSSWWTASRRQRVKKRHMDPKILVFLYGFIKLDKGHHDALCRRSKHERRGIDTFCIHPLSEPHLIEQIIEYTGHNDET